MALFSKIVGCLFGGAFTLVGTLIAFDTIVPSVSDWNRMRSWQPTSATLIELKGGDNHIDSQYHYRYKGQDYQNNRTYVNQFNDNIGSYHQTLYQKLKHAKVNDLAIRIWLDPKAPQNAVIDRDMRWGLFTIMSLFCGTFILIGLLAITFTLRAKRSIFAHTRNRNFNRQKQWLRHNQQADQPISFQEFCQQNNIDAAAENNPSIESEQWQKRKGWQSHRIRSDAKSKLLGYWIFAIFWNAISIPIQFQIPEAFDENPIAALIIPGFQVAGCFLLYLAIQTTLRYARFGIVELFMDPYPGAIGGRVGGTVQIQKLSLEEWGINATDFEVTLECVYSYVSGTGKNRSRREDIKWSQSGVVEKQRANPGILLAFYFEVPKHLPEAEYERGTAYFFWRLTINAELPGADFNRSYDIPVLSYTPTATAAQGTNISQLAKAKQAEHNERQSQAIEQGQFELTDLNKVAKIAQLGDDLTIYFPPLRNLLLTFFAAIFGVGFSFAAWMINANSGGLIMSVFMFLFSIPFALVGLIGSCAMIYLPLNSLKVVFSGREVRATRSLIGIPVQKRRASYDDIEKISVKRTGSTGQGSDKITHFKLIAHTQHNQQFTLAEDINGEALAEAFSAFLYAKIQ